MSSIFINPSNRGKLPRFSSSDKSLERAFNLLAEAIESKVIPDISFGGKGGHVDWRPGSVILRPKAVVQNSAVVASTVIPPLTITSSKPSYLPDAGALIEGHARFWITWGTTNGTLADNWTDCVDIPLATDLTKHVLIKATLSNSSDLEVTSSEWKVVDSLEAPNKTPAWGSDGSPPEYAIVHLGQIAVVSGVATAFNISGGSILISDYVHDITSDGTGGVTFKKRLAHVRLTY